MEDRKRTIKRITSPCCLSMNYANVFLRLESLISSPPVWFIFGWMEKHSTRWIRWNRRFSAVMNFWKHFIAFRLFTCRLRSGFRGERSCLWASAPARYMEIRFRFESKKVCKLPDIVRSDMELISAWFFAFYKNVFSFPTRELKHVEPNIEICRFSDWYKRVGVT